MKHFRFRLDSVLTLRNWEEERIRTAYGLALQQERRFIAQLQGVEARLEQDMAVLRGATAATVPAGERTTRWRHLLMLERERSDTQQKLLTARRIREQKMKLLLDAHRRVQILDALRDRQKLAHTTEAFRREEKEIEELVSARRSPAS